MTTNETTMTTDPSARETDGAPTETKAEQDARERSPGSLGNISGRTFPEPNGASRFVCCRCSFGVHSDGFANLADFRLATIRHMEAHELRSVDVVGDAHGAAVPGRLTDVVERPAERGNVEQPRRLDGVTSTDAAALLANVYGGSAPTATENEQRGVRFASTDVDAPPAAIGVACDQTGALAKVLKALASFAASKDRMRFAMHSVRFTPRPFGRARLEATDGRILARLEFDVRTLTSFASDWDVERWETEAHGLDALSDDVEGSAGSSVLLDASECKRLRASDVVGFTAAGGVRSGARSDALVPMLTVEGSFLDVESVIPAAAWGRSTFAAYRDDARHSYRGEPDVSGTRAYHAFGLPVYTAVFRLASAVAKALGSGDEAMVPTFPSTYGTPFRFDVGAHPDVHGTPGSRWALTIIAMPMTAEHTCSDEQRDALNEADDASAALLRRAQMVARGIATPNPDGAGDGE